jgi:hypothetical protein
MGHRLMLCIGMAALSLLPTGLRAQDTETQVGAMAAALTHIRSGLPKEYRSKAAVLSIDDDSVAVVPRAVSMAVAQRIGLGTKRHGVPSSGDVFLHVETADIDTDAATFDVAWEAQRPNERPGQMVKRVKLVREGKAWRVTESKLISVS